MSHNFLLVREAAERLGVSGEKVRQLVAEGRLTGRKQDPEKATSPFQISLESVEVFERLRDGVSVE
jgi:transposase